MSDNPGPDEDFAPGAERPPWVRRVVGALALALVVFAGLWLVLKVVVPARPPAASPAVAVKKPAKHAPKVQVSSDDAAWVRALEQDTLEGYRQYLALFANGKHVDEAHDAINAYDNRAWDIALERQTIAGYQDYLNAWPEGLHAAKAKELVSQMKAKAQGIAKDAAERAAQDTADWETAARQNTIGGYGRYLTKHPAGKHAGQAQKRINALRRSAADHKAWQQAKAANTVAAYQQYLKSFAHGAFVAKAIAAIERLRPAPGKSFRDCPDCPLMVSLPPGTATLGAAAGDATARPDEKPARPVTFASLFAIGVTEVTFAQWDACVAAGGCDTRPAGNGWGRGQRPVINVSWDDAQRYARWISAKTGFAYSLPSEAQWEYAARGGDEGVWAGGSLKALCAFANGASRETGLKWANMACIDPASDRTLPVGVLGANGFGLRDMIGNVAEWTLDCNTLNLRDAPTDGGADMRGSCNQRVARGGSWFSGPADLRYYSRLMLRRGDRNDFTGFRLVRKIEQ